MSVSVARSGISNSSDADRSGATVVALTPALLAVANITGGCCYFSYHPDFFAFTQIFLSKLNSFEGCCQLATSQISIFVKIKPFLLKPHNICCEPHNRELLILTRFIISFYFNPTLVTGILKSKKCLQTTIAVL